MDKKALVICLLFIAPAFSVPVFAKSITYDINFPTTFNGIAPTGGSFTYDPTTGFSDFQVQWNGFTFDETASANAPFVGAGTATPSYGFSLMSQTLPGSSVIYDWSDVSLYPHSPGTGGEEVFTFRAYDPSTITSSMIEASVGSCFPVCVGESFEANGTWSISPTTVPEPSSILLFGTGLLSSMAMAFRRKLLA